MASVAATPRTADARAVAVVLGTAADFGVLAGSTVTNTGATIVTGDLGVSPGATVTGFPPGTVIGVIHAGDAAAAQAQADLTLAYNDAVSRTPDATIATELGGTTVLPGVYNSAAGTFQLTGNVTLDAQGDPDAVFIFQAATTLISAAGASVTLIGGAQACNVFWQVGSSATLGANTDFSGNILALTSITVGAGTTVDGRTLARNGAVTLDSDTITAAECAGPPDRTTTTTVNSTCALNQDGPITFVATVRATNGSVPTGPVEFFSDGVSIGTAQLDSTGHAELTVANLTEGSHEIVAVFPGTVDLDGSTSPIFVQRVDAQGFCYVEDCWSQTCATPVANLLSTRPSQLSTRPRRPSAQRLCDPRAAPASLRTGSRGAWPTSVKARPRNSP
ncbi:ice-binding family protein [Sphaerisporangium sp. TRM90804]|uniref:ice-binding family protein n=1 Tax=Sphaerisporangium sp. TRM90804 TaxID=3031113 RepID=UPI002447A0C7|nr:ice-binding family protein [Sphaerisporangium sp. TRM90804]MDH2430508.1 ice-binding family protein [Sphaerisporangium sp. TRM90804]